MGAEGKDWEWAAPPPSEPPIRGSAADSEHTLPRFLQAEGATVVQVTRGDGFGAALAEDVFCDRKALLERLAAL